MTAGNVDSRKNMIYETISPLITNCVKSESKRAMEMLALNPRVVFIGQNVAYGGHWLYDSLADVPADRKIEMPVAENLQMGISIGLALAGYVPVSCYRMDFLLLAMDQLVNHLDKLSEMSQGGFIPKVIVRVIVTPTKPLDPGPQHRQDHTEALRLMLKHTPVLTAAYRRYVMDAYEMAMKYDGSAVVVEVP